MAAGRPVLPRRLRMRAIGHYMDIVCKIIVTFKRYTFSEIPLTGTQCKRRVDVLLTSIDRVAFTGRRPCHRLLRPWPAASACRQRMLSA